MSIKKWFTTSATVKRQSQDEDVYGNKFSSFATVGTITGKLQQGRNAGFTNTSEVIESLGLSFTNTYIFWTDINSDVDEGDTLTISGSDYAVRAVQTNDTGKNQHLELILEKT